MSATHPLVPSRNTQNEIMRQHIRNTAQCVIKLNDMGCTVLSVSIESTPTVVIADQRSLSKRLNGLRYTHSNKPGGMRYRYQARLEHCRVIWETNRLEESR